MDFYLLLDGCTLFAESSRLVYTNGRSRATYLSDTLLTHDKAFHVRSFLLDIEHVGRHYLFLFLLFCFRVPLWNLFLLF